MSLLATISALGIWARLALMCLEIVKSLMDKVREEDLINRGFNQAVDATTIAIYKKLGRTDEVIAIHDQMTPEEKRKIALED